jgi:hypothetical protein
MRWCRGILPQLFALGHAVAQVPFRLARVEVRSSLDVPVMASLFPIFLVHRPKSILKTQPRTTTLVSLPAAEHPAGCDESVNWLARRISVHVLHTQPAYSSREAGRACVHASLMNTSCLARTCRCGDNAVRH